MEPIGRALLTLAAAALSLCFGAAIAPGAHAAKAKTKEYSPTKVRWDFKAKIAASGNSLWLAVIGMDKRRNYLIKTYRFNGRKWRPLPGAPKTLYEKGLKFAVLTTPTGARVPCIGDSPRDQGRIRCHEDGAWRTIPTPDGLRDFALAGLRSEGSRLTALYGKWNFSDDTTTVQAASLSGGTIETTGPPLHLDSYFQSDLGETTVRTEPGPIDLALMDWATPRYGQLSLATLDETGWTRSPMVPDSSGGRQYTGPVRDQSTVFLPAIRNGREAAPNSDWPLFLMKSTGESWSTVGSRIGAKGGAADGGAFAVGNRIWVLRNWLRLIQKRRTTTVKANFKALRVAADGSGFDRRMTLWKKPIWDPSFQATEYRGKPVFVYTRFQGSRERAIVVMPR